MYYALTVINNEIETRMCVCLCSAIVTIKSATFYPLTINFQTISWLLALNCSSSDQTHNRRNKRHSLDENQILWPIKLTFEWFVLPNDRTEMEINTDQFPGHLTPFQVNQFRLPIGDDWKTCRIFHTHRIRMMTKTHSNIIWFNIQWPLTIDQSVQSN